MEVGIKGADACVLLTRVGEITSCSVKNEENENKRKRGREKL